MSGGKAEPLDATWIPGDRAWLQDAEHIWLPGVLEGVSRGQATFRLSSPSLPGFTTDSHSKTVTVDDKRLSQLDQVEAAQLEGVDDICALSAVQQASMLHTVRVRYFRQLIYTRVGRILIVVNPFKPLPIYSTEYIDQYRSVVDSTTIAPHIYGLGHDTLRGMRLGAVQNHVVLISGESGAGKTESSKLILSFVAECVAGESQDNIEDKILQTSPIFEAFGNATTVRNANSSRFGKWLDLRFSREMQILGCELSQYLLETTRVCKQAKEERNYHIFFQMIRGLTEGCDSPRLPSLRQRRDLFLKKTEEYKYLRDGCTHIDSIDDIKRFEDTLDAFASVGIDMETQFEVFKVLSAVLLFGNCDIVADGDAARLADDAPLQTVAQLLGVDAQKLTSCMLIRKIVVGAEVMEKPLQEHQARESRDSLARLLYGRLFEWLVAKMNQALNAGSEPAGSDKRLGVLDIAGFEFFEHNSLEQLLINLSNEHLQQSFNQTIFTGELEEISKEGIDLGSELTFNDNSDCLALISGKGGILDLLDENVALPKATDDKYCTNVLQAHAKHPRLVKPKYPASIFGVRHFAGEVFYSCDGFLQKNANKPPDGSMELMGGSTLYLLRRWAEGDDTTAYQTPTSRGKARKAPTIASSFRSSMKALMDKISTAERHYIRCIKPNKQKVASRFDAPMVMEQLSFSGILEAVRIRRVGFSSRLPFLIFMARYGRLVTDLKEQRRSKLADLPKEHEDKVQLVKGLVKALAEKFSDSYPADAVRVGHSKVLMKTEAVTVLDKARAGNLHWCAIALQAAARARRARERHRIFQELNTQMREWLRRVDASTAQRDSHPLPPLPMGSLTARLKSKDAVEEAIKEGALMLDDAVQSDFKNKIVQQIERVLVRLQQELDLSLELKALQESSDPVVIERALARADALGLGVLPERKELATRLDRLCVQLPLQRAKSLGIDVPSAESAVEEQQPTAESASEFSAEPSSAVEEQSPVVEAETRKAASGLPQEDQTAKEVRVNEEEEVEYLPAVNRDKGKKGKKTRKSTVTGLSPQAQDNILESLRRAVAEYDVEELEKHLGEARVNGLEQEDLEDIRKVFYQLQDEAFIENALEEMSGGKEQDDVRMLNLKAQLSKLRQCKAIDIGPEDQFDEDEDKDGEPSVLKNYPGLKQPRMWKGHRKSVAVWTARASVRASMTATKSEKGVAKKNLMLYWSKDTIAEALTQKVPRNEEEKAVQNFRNILYYMADKPAQDLIREASFDYIVSLATRTEFRDEIFCQVIKQMTRNPVQRSINLGWHLLLLLCQSVQPSPDLLPFIKKFLERKMSQDEDDASRAGAAACIQAIEMRMLPVLRGHLWKKKPSKLALKIYDKRYFVLGNHQLFWWEKQDDFLRPESARPRGGPLCKGVIDFTAEECDLDAIGSSDGTQFCIRPRLGHWSASFDHTAGDPKRAFLLDTKGLEHGREVWLTAIKAHLEYAERCRAQKKNAGLGQSFAGRIWAGDGKNWVARDE